MRSIFITLLFIGTFFFVSHVAIADDFINDTDIINIPFDVDEGIVVPETESPLNVPLPDSDSDEVITFGDDEEGGGEDVIDEVIINADDSSSGEGEGGGGGDTNDGDSVNEGSGAQDSGSETVSASSILDTLTGNQALTSGSAGGGSGGTSLSGSKTRAALLGRGITKITIPAPPTSSSDDSESQGGASYTRNDLALIVSAALVQTPNIQDVFFTTDSISISYQARGRLFFALPLTYTTKLDLKFDESNTRRRVAIDFPWYKFLMWTGVSKNQLRNQVDVIITTAPQGKQYDRATFVFEGVADILGRVGGALSGSVRTIQ